MKPGDEMKLKTLGPVFDGKRVTVIRKSNVTGGLTVELLEDCGAYRKGDKLHVKPYEVEIIV